MTDRRKFLQLAALGGGAVFISALSRAADRQGYAAVEEDFYFVQLSDCHWGYSGAANLEARNTLKKAVASVNALPVQPDFIIFTGDLTHATEDPQERRERMAGFRDIVADLKVRNIRYIPGEHDAAADFGAAFQEYFGATHYAFDHKGVHFITLDNVSDPGASIGDAQLAWLKADLAAQKRDAQIVVFTHRPLFPLVPKWDWATRDGQKAIDILLAYPNVTVFYGHIHQENHHQTGHIAHHSAKSLIFPLPAPGSQDKRTPLPWDPAMPFNGLGFRDVAAEVKMAQRAFRITEHPVATEAT